MMAFEVHILIFIIYTSKCVGEFDEISNLELVLPQNENLKLRNLSTDIGILRMNI